MKKTNTDTVTSGLLEAHVVNSPNQKALYTFNGPMVAKHLLLTPQGSPYFSCPSGQLYYNAMVPMPTTAHQGRSMKYGVISMDHLQTDLQDWAWLYTAGRCTTHTDTYKVDIYL